MSLVLEKCRLCQDPGPVHCSIFDRSHNVQFAEMVMAFTKIKVQFDDGLPNKICANCAERLVGVYIFARVCEKMDHCLREHLNIPNHGESPQGISSHSKIQSQSKKVTSQESIPSTSTNSSLKYRPTKSTVDCPSNDQHKRSNGKVLTSPRAHPTIDEKRYTATNSFVDANNPPHFSYSCNVCKSTFTLLIAFNEHRKMCQKLFNEQNASQSMIVEEMNEIVPPMTIKAIPRAATEAPSHDRANQNLNNRIPVNADQVSKNISYNLTNGDDEAPPLETYVKNYNEKTKMKKSEASKIFKCTTCNRTFSFFTWYKRHVNKCIMLKNSRNQTKTMIAKNVTTQLQSNLLVCMVCKKEFETKLSFQNHLLYVHELTSIRSRLSRPPSPYQM